jgi:hypothetical protein
LQAKAQETQLQVEAVTRAKDADHAALKAAFHAKEAEYAALEAALMAKDAQQAAKLDRAVREKEAEWQDFVKAAVRSEPRTLSLTQHRCQKARPESKPSHPPAGRSLSVCSSPVGRVCGNGTGPRSLSCDRNWRY